MGAFEAVVLGIVQGLTEYLPISSTAHLRIIPALAGWPDPGAAFTAVTQLGTMAAVLAFFRSDLIHIARAWLGGLRDRAVRQTVESRLGWYILLGTIPVGVFGLVFEGEIESGARNLHLIAAALICLGLLLLVADAVGSHSRSVTALGARDATVIGLAQALALVPGVSRSGATITAGLFMGLERAAAARYSFLLSVPAVVLSGLFELRDVTAPGGAGVLATVLATALAFIVGYASIAFLLRYLVAHTTAVFVAYRVALGGFLLIWLWVAGPGA